MLATPARKASGNSTFSSAVQPGETDYRLLKYDADSGPDRVDGIGASVDQDGAGGLLTAAGHHHQKRRIVPQPLGPTSTTRRPGFTSSETCLQRLHVLVLTVLKIIWSCTLRDGNRTGAAGPALSGVYVRQLACHRLF